MAKQLKSREQLQSLIRERLRDHEECRGVHLTIIEVAGRAPDHPNWRPMFLSPGKKAVPPVAWGIVREIGSEFDLIPEPVVKRRN